MSGPALVVEVVGGDYRVGLIGQEIIKTYFLMLFYKKAQAHAELRVGEVARFVIAAYA